MRQWAAFGIDLSQFNFVANFSAAPQQERQNKQLKRKLSGEGSSEESSEETGEELREEARELSSEVVGFPKGMLILALLIIILWGVTIARAFLVPVCVSALLAFLLVPAIRLMKRLYFPDWLAITLCAIFLLVPLPALGYILINQGQSLAKEFPSIVHSLNQFLESLHSNSVIRGLRLTSYFDPAEISNKLTRAFSQGIQIAISSLGALLGATSQVALVLLFAILMLSARHHLRVSAERLISRSKSIHAVEMLDAVTILIERFLLARLLIVIIVTALDTLILTLFGLQYSFLMASFLGLMTLLPAVGFIVGVIPPLIVVLATSLEGSMIHIPSRGVSALVLFLALLVVSFIEGNILTPKLVGHRLNINTLSSFLGIFAGGLIWGIWGMLLAIPFLGVLRIIFSAVPRLEVWGDFLAEKEDKVASKRLRISENESCRSSLGKLGGKPRK